MTDRNDNMDNTANNSGDEILERNVEQLLSRAYEPPKMAAEARGRILDSLKGELAVEPEPERRWFETPRFRIGAFAGAAAVALAVLAVAPSDSTRGPVVHHNTDTTPRWVSLQDGSRVLLNRGARVSVVGKRHMILTRGELMLDVAKGDGEFVVDSPEGRVVVLGTKFVLNADDGKTWAAVVRGKVRLENGVGKQTLRAGEQGTIRRGQAPSRRPARRLSHLTSWAKAAQREQKVQTKPVRRGTLLARVPNWQQQQYPLPMRSLNVDVHVDNQVARVAIDQTFFNEQNRQLEGVYRFPLPAGASISRLAMYVAGKRMESAIVERQRAREIYEGIVYRRRDPALLEWMAGNLFKVRIFPLPARQEKRILLSYTQSIERLYDDYRIEVPIPEVDEPVGKVNYRVRIAGCATCQIKSTSHDVQVKPDGKDAIVSFAATNYTIGDDLLLAVRDKRKEASVAYHRAGKAGYWMVRAQPSFAKGALRTDAKPRRWVILNDTSASRGPLERKAQAHIINRLLGELDEDDQLNIVAFDTSARRFASKFVRVRDVDRVSVSQFVEDQGKDGVGSTDLEVALTTAVELLGAKGAADYEPHILYLGDGIITGGERTLKTLSGLVRGKATVVSVAVGKKMDSMVLRGLASATGGMFTTMNPGDDLGWRSFDMIAALNTPRLVDVEASLLDGEGRAITEGSTYVSARQLADGEELSVVAKLGGAVPATLQLRALRNGKPWSTKIALANSVDPAAGYLPRLWAQRRITALIGDGAANHKAELVKLGMSQFLMTPFTSLLVLENDKMYKQYKVKRDRKQGWAAYDVPDTIKVVREPLTNRWKADPNVALDAIMLRRPLQLVRSYNQRYRGDIGGVDFDGDRWAVRGGGGFARPTAGGESTLLTLRRSGWADNRRQIRLASGAHRVDVVTATDKTAGQPRRDWTVNLGRKGLETEDGNNVRKPLSQPVGGLGTTSITTKPRGARVLVDAKDSKREKNKGPSVFKRVLEKQQRAGDFRGNIDRLRGLGGRGRFVGGKSGYFGYYSYAPYPVAYNTPYDRRLDDLTEFVPALFVDQLDSDLYELLRTDRANRRGTITADARALVARARKALGARSYRSAHGAVFRLGANGTFAISSKTSGLLTEGISFDGAKLRHTYPELGLVVERDMSDAVALLLSHWAPFVMPEANALARWYDVSLADPRTLRLRWGSKADAPALEIALDANDRIREVRAVHGNKRAVDVKLSYSNDAMTIERDGVKATWLHELSAKSADVSLPAAQQTRVEMPLRRPAYWQAKAKKLTVGSMEWRHVQRQLLASYAAQRQTHRLQLTVAGLITAGAKLSRGEVALASHAAASVPKLDVLQAALGAWAKNDRMVDYLTTSWRYARKRKRAAFRGIAGSAKGSLFGMLASYRDALDAGFYVRDHAKVQPLVEAFAADYQQPALRYVLAHRFQSQFRYKAPMQAAAMWKLVAKGIAKDNGWARVATYEAGRVLYTARKYNEAAEHFERLFKSSRGLPRIDHMVVNAFRNSSRGLAGWRMMWTKWRDRVLRKGTANEVLALLRAARTANESGDYDRIVARLSQMDIKDPTTVVTAVGLLRAVSRNHQALAMLEPWVKPQGKRKAIPALVEVASWITESQGRLPEAAAYLEQAMNQYYKKAVSLTTMRRDFQRLIRLHTQLAQSARGAKRKGYVNSALKAAAQWRLVDPDNAQIDRQAAGLLFSVGRNADAWRYLSTAIERHPMEGRAYKTVAEALEKEGRVKMAEPLWRRAVEVEPTNPTWLLRHAQALHALGRHDDAAAQIKTILDKKWHNRFFRVTNQAKNLKRLYAR